jgi:hypothetical protein
MVCIVVGVTSRPETRHEPPVPVVSVIPPSPPPGPELPEVDVEDAFAPPFPLVNVWLVEPLFFPPPHAASQAAKATATPNTFPGSETREAMVATIRVAALGRQATSW